MQRKSYRKKKYFTIIYKLPTNKNDFDKKFSGLIEYDVSKY